MSALLRQAFALHTHIPSFRCTPILSLSHSVVHSFSHSLIHVHSFSHSFIHSGSRGVSFRHYHSGSINSLNALRSHANYPNNPNGYGVYPSYTTKDDRKWETPPCHKYGAYNLLQFPRFRRNNYGERLEAFFNPLATGNHSFFVAVDDQAEVQLGQGTNISNLDLWVTWCDTYYDM